MWEFHHHRTSPQLDKERQKNWSDVKDSTFFRGSSGKNSPKLQRPKKTAPQLFSRGTLDIFRKTIYISRIRPQNSLFLIRARVPKDFPLLSCCYMHKEAKDECLITRLLENIRNGYFKKYVMKLLQKKITERNTVKLPFCDM